MDNEDKQKVANYLEIYANAFNGMVQDALAGKFTGDPAEIQKSAMAAFDPDRLKNPF